MAVLASEEFEAGTIGAAVQEAEVIFVNVDNTGITYVTGLNGTAKACNVSPATTGACRDAGFAALSKAVVRFIFKFSSLPALDTIIAHMCSGDPNAGGLRIANLYLTTTGKLVIRNNFTVVGTSTMTFVAGTEYAVEWMFDGPNQQQTLRMFTNLALTASAVESIGPAAATAAPTVDWIQVGKMTNTTWTGGLTFDRYKRANDWVSSAASTANVWLEEWVGTDGNDISVPGSWAKEGPNTASPKYKIGGPNTDQSYLNFASQSVGNRNLVSLQMPSGLAPYERFYLMLNAKPVLPEENETIWSAGTLAGVTLFRLVVAPGVGKNYNLELWADDDWNPTAPQPGEGQPPLPPPLGIIEDLAIDFFHRVEITVNATSGPAMCTVNVWEGTRLNEPATPDQTAFGTCVGTSLLRYRRYGQTLHSSVAPTVSHKGVAFDGIQLAQNGVAIGPLPLAQQFDPPLNQDWQFYEWDGANLIPLTLAGASLGGSALEEVQFTDQIPPNGGGKLFTADPGLGKKLYVTSDASASPRFDAVADLFNYEMRTLSAGVGHPKSDRVAPGCYRYFHGARWGGRGMPSFSAFDAGSWDESRKAAANTAMSSWSFDLVNAADALTIPNHDYDDWLTKTLAPFIKDIYERYGHLYCFDLGNEPDANAPTYSPLYLYRVRKAVRYLHFFLKDQCDVPEEAFMVSMANTFTQMATNHDNAHKVAVNTTDGSWPGARGDALYYWIADWKGTRTVSDGYWSDAYDPNPADFVQPGDFDEWGYGRGPTMRIMPCNHYDRQYEHLNGNDTLAKFRADLVSIGGTQYGRAGNRFRFNKALWGGATPVLDVSSANANGIPVFIGELGLGVWNPLPYTDNPAEPGPTADAYCETIIKDLVEKCNVVAYAKWRYIPSGYTNNGGDVDSFTQHHKTNGLSRGGHLWDPTNSNTKAEAAIFNTDYVADAPPWPNGTKRPPYIQNAADTKRDRRGFADIANVT